MTEKWEDVKNRRRLLDAKRYAVSLLDTAAELDRQHELWGEQNHPLLADFSDYEVPYGVQREYYARKEVQYQLHNDVLSKEGLLGWDTILLEEVFEALSEEDPDKQYTELIQVAAVALNAAMSNRRNKNKEAA